MFYTINENSSFEIVEKKSRFISNLIFIENREEAEKVIKEYKKKFHDARHNCYAYRVLEKNGIYEKSSDDGEPSGTAGAPMLSLLQKNELVNVIVIVTRYFGGILLGTGGLVRAYSLASLGVIDKTSKLCVEYGVEYKIEIEYAEIANFKYNADKLNITIIDVKYDEFVTFKVQMNIESEKKLLNSINNQEINIKYLNKCEEKYIKF